MPNFAHNLKHKKTEIGTCWHCIPKNLNMEAKMKKQSTKSHHNDDGGIKSRLYTSEDSPTCSSSNPSLGSLLDSDDTTDISLESNSNRDDPSYSSSDGSEYLSEEEVVVVGRKSSQNAQQKNLSRLTQIHLENVQYLSCFDETSRTSEVSTVNFIDTNQQSTKDIFIRRLIPSDIVADDEDAGVSLESCSTVTADSESKVAKRRKKPSELLSNVDYVSAIDIARDHDDISTVGYKIPYQIARDAFDRKKARPSRRMEKKEEDNRSRKNTAPLHIPSRIEMKIGSSSFSSIEPSFSDGDVCKGTNEGKSDEATRSRKKDKENTIRKFDSREYQKPYSFLKSKNSKEEDEADTRIRYLKEKIRELQGKSLGGMDSQKPKKDSFNPRKTIIGSVDIQNQAETKGLREVDQDFRRERRNKFVNDTPAELELSNKDHIEENETNTKNSDRSGIKTKDSPKVPRKDHKTSAGLKEAIPLHVPFDKQDDMSEMDDESDYYPNAEEPDIENAVRSALERKKKRENKMLLTKAGKRTMKILQEGKVSILSLWVKRTAGRSRMEIVLIGTIAFSMFVLFVLLIVVLASK